MFLERITCPQTSASKDVSSLREDGIDVKSSHSSKTYFSFHTEDAIIEAGVVLGVAGGPEVELRPL